MNDLVVVHLYFANDAGDLRAEWSEIALNVCVVGCLLDLCAFPAIPIARNCDNDRRGQRDDNHRGPVLLPSGLQHS